MLLSMKQQVSSFKATITVIVIRKMTNKVLSVKLKQSRKLTHMGMKIEMDQHLNMGSMTIQYLLPVKATKI